MVPLIFILFSFFLKFVIAFNLNETNFIYQYQNSNDTERFHQCLNDLVMNSSKLTIEEKKENIACILEEARDKPKQIGIFFNNLKAVIPTVLKPLLNNTGIEFLYDLLNDIFNGTFFGDLFNVIEKHPELVNYTIILVKEEIDGKNITQEDILDFMNKILNIEGMNKVINHIINSTYNDAILTLIETKLMNNTNYAGLYKFFKPILIKHKKQIIHLIFDILKAYNNNSTLTEVIKKFFIDKNNEDLMRDLKEKFKDEKARKEFSAYIIFWGRVGTIIKEELLEHWMFYEHFFFLIKNEQIAHFIADFIVHSQNSTYLENKIPDLIKILYGIDKNYMSYLLDVYEKIIKRVAMDITTYIELSEKIIDMIYNMFFKKNISTIYDINDECLTSIRKIYFNKISLSNTTNPEGIYPLLKMRYFFMKKATLDTTKNKNDFLTYENCLEKKFDNTLLERSDFNFTLKPIYILAMIDDNKTKNNFNDSIYIEQFDYWIGHCLPLPQKNDSNKTINICEQKDYSGISRIILEMSSNMKSAVINTISIDDKNFETKDKIYCAISFIIIFIPLIIQFFLYIYYTISYYKYKKRKIINRLTINQEEEMKKKNHLISQKENNININNDKIIFPNWYIYLNEYFNLVKNGAELFKKNSRESNVNNINGITYIKGLLGISMLLYIFGHLYLIIFNLPFKNITPSYFISSVKNPLFCIPFIGLRYSPRIILSCSGYTLIYKYLSYIDQKQKNYLLKFIIRQSYKYILLILVILYMRYSVYYLNMILSLTKRPMMEILKYNLNENDESFYKNFFTFLLAYIGSSSFKEKQNIIQYFYIPINEIFLFLLSVIFISLGYRYKLRNDIIIIILIILLFIGKIFLYIFYVHGKNKYSTLYFYLYDYGAIMLNPIFNLSSFLIGMFFGLINYSIQKGISLYSNEYYHRIFNIDNKEIDNEPKPDNEKTSIKRQNTLADTKSSLLELNSYDDSRYTKVRQDEDLRSYSEILIEDKKTKNKINSSNKDPDDISTVKSDINEISLTSNEKLKEMPFLILPTNFLEFYKKNRGRFYFRLIIMIFILLIALFSCIQFIYTGKYAIINDFDDRKMIMEKLSFKKVIISPSLNFFYVIDIELVVFMVNFVFFVLYSKGYQRADIYNFFDNNFWSFFLKCYYSFIIISTPIILNIMYQSETVIKFDILNLILFSFISLFIILLGVILFYSMFEIPFKKMFKSIFVKEEILNESINDDVDNNNFDSDLQGKL